MNIVDKNDGQKIEYSVNGNTITFRDEMMLNLSKYERDYPVELDICESRDGILVMGMSDLYVAQLLIPARSYTQTAIEGTGTGEGSRESIINTPVPFDVNKVTLTLWALEEADN